jgi:hypothetical protein
VERTLAFHSLTGRSNQRSVPLYSRANLYNSNPPSLMAVCLVSFGSFVHDVFNQYVHSAIVPLYLIVHCGLVALELPGMVLSYNPEVWEFALILIPSIQFLVVLASRCVPAAYRGPKVKSE